MGDDHRSMGAYWRSTEACRPQHTLTLHVSTSPLAVCDTAKLQTVSASIRSADTQLNPGDLMESVQKRDSAASTSLCSADIQLDPTSLLSSSNISSSCVPSPLLSVVRVAVRRELSLEFDDDSACGDFEFNMSGIEDLLDLSEDEVNDKVTGDGGRSSEDSEVDMEVTDNVDRLHSDKVTSTSNKKRRKYDKTLSCVFCGKLLKMKMKRHLITVHKSEPEVEQLMSLSDAGERERGFARLRMRGNFNYNSDRLRRGEGSLIYCRRSRYRRSPRKYLPCVHCIGMFLARNLHRHTKACAIRKVEDAAVTDRRSCTTASRYLLAGAVEGERSASKKFKSEVLCNMRSLDNVSAVCEQYKLISHFGLTLHCRLGRSRANDISQRMRQLGRLLIEVNSKRDAPVTLNDCIAGNSFDDLVDATVRVCQPYEDPSGRPLYRNPTFGLKIGHSIGHSAALKKGMGMRASDVSMVQEAETFCLCINQSGLAKFHLQHLLL